MPISMILDQVMNVYYANTSTYRFNTYFQNKSFYKCVDECDKGI